MNCRVNFKARVSFKKIYTINGSGMIIYPAPPQEKSKLRGAKRRGNPSELAANVQPRQSGLSPLILPMDCRAPAGLAVSDLFGVGIFIEIARSEAKRRGNPSELAANVQLRQSGLSPLILPMDCRVGLFALLAVSESFGAEISSKLQTRVSGCGNPSATAAQFNLTVFPLPDVPCFCNRGFIAVFENKPSRDSIVFFQEDIEKTHVNHHLKIDSNRFLSNNFSK